MPAQAQSTAPTFTCAPDAFNVFGNPGNLQRFDPATRSVLSSIPLAPAVVVNGIGYNPLDNYIYGLSSGDIARVAVDGSVEILGEPTPATPGLPAFTPNINSGTMDASGNYYGVGNNNIFVVDIGTNPAAGTLTYTVIPRTGVTGAPPLDIAFSPLDGALYGARGGLFRFDLTTGFGESVTTSGATLPNSGGAWSISDGTVFFYRNASNPRLFSVNLTSTVPVITDLGSVPGNGTFDSTACLPPTLTKGVVGSGPDVNGQFSYEFTISNAFSNTVTVNFSDPLPSELRYVLGTLSPALPGGSTVTTFTTTDLALQNVAIPAAGSVTFEVMVELAPGLAAGTVVQNQATIEFGGVTIPSDDPSTGATGDGTGFSIDPAPSLSIVKPAPVNVSDPLLDAPNDTITCPSVAIGGTCVLTGAHTVTAAEANATPLTNTASVESDEVTTPVTATVNTPINVNPVVATDDSTTAVAGAMDVVNVFDGDTVNGDPASATNATVSVAPGSSVPPELTFDPSDGTIDVVAGTPAGTYSFDYQICEVANPTNCETATVTVTIDPAPSLSIVKPAPVNGCPQ